MSLRSQFPVDPVQIRSRSRMPAGMKPLEKFLKKQTTALTRSGAFGLVDKTGSGAALGGLGGSGSRRRASLSRVVPFFRETSPESSPRDVFRSESFSVEVFCAERDLFQRKVTPLSCVVVKGQGSGVKVQVSLFSRSVVNTTAIQQLQIS